MTPPLLAGDIDGEALLRHNSAAVNSASVCSRIAIILFFAGLRRLSTVLLFEGRFLSESIGASWKQNPSVPAFRY
jgi:hypothetical protein